MLIDTHAHLNFNAFKEDWNEVIKRCLKEDIWIINVGTKYETSKKAVEIAQKYEKGVYAAVGVHPIHLAEGIFKVKLDEEEQAFRTKNEDFDFEKYKELAKNEKVVAIGETGFDYYYRPKTKKKLEGFKNRQKEVFLRHLDLAQELNLPVIFHCRVAHDDLLNILNSQFLIHNSKLRGVMHCFVGSLEQLQRYLEMGFYIGFDGIIFKKIEGIDFDEIIKKTPLERILIETDCPYLMPTLAEGRNEPIYVKYIAERIAKIKGISFKEIAEITTQNAQGLFKINTGA